MLPYIGKHGQVKEGLRSNLYLLIFHLDASYFLCGLSHAGVKPPFIY